MCAIEPTEQLQCGAEAASEMQQKIGRLKHSWSHDDAGGAELGGASGNVDDGDHGGIYNCKYLPVQCSLYSFVAWLLDVTINFPPYIQA